MGVKRIGNPRFQQGVNSRGHKSWRLNPNAVVVDADGLRSGLEDGVPPLSQLGEQFSPHEVRSFKDDADYHGRKAAESLNTLDLFSRGMFGGVYAAAGTAISVGGLATGAGVLAAGLAFLPFGVMGAAVFFTGPIRSRLAAWRAKRKFIENREVPPRRELLREGREMVRRYPRLSATDEQASTKDYVSEDNFRRSKIRSTVSEEGLGEISWVEKGNDGTTSSGSFLLYPGANLHQFHSDFPVAAPKVNLRGAELAGSYFPVGSNLDGGDFRDANAEQVRWAASLRGASLVGVNLRGSVLDECDMDGADLTGADVTDAKLPFDLTGTNISREQLDSLAFMGDNWDGVPYRVREVSVDDLVGRYGSDRDEVVVAVWAGDVEVRDRQTNRVVSGEYDTDDHYIPYWVIADKGHRVLT